MGVFSPSGLSVKVVAVRLAGSIPSAKTAVTLVLASMPLARGAGVTRLTFGAVVSTVQVWLSGVGSTVPPSTARTLTV